MFVLPKLQKSRRFAHQILYKKVLSNSSSLIVAMSILKLELFSREPRLFKRVCPSDRPLVGRSITLLSAVRDKTASG